MAKQSFKDNTGAIFKNSFKEKSTQPDYKGKCLVDGAEKELALWVAETKNGEKYFRMSIQDPYKPQEATEKESLVDNPDDDLPF